MADATNDGTLTDQQPEGRPEAAARIANQRDQYRSELEQLAKATATIDQGYLAFKGMEGFTGDPYAAAKAVAQSGITFDPDNPDDFSGKVTDWWAGQKRMLGIPDQPPPVTSAEPDQGETVRAVKVPGATGPNPAAGGGTPPAEKLTWASPEVQELYRKNDMDGIKKLISEGRFQPSPGNPAARNVSR